jgi:hypothetical protein
MTCGKSRTGSVSDFVRVHEGAQPARPDYLYSHPTHSAEHWTPYPDTRVALFNFWDYQIASIRLVDGTINVNLRAPVTGVGL